ncbi:piriformospora indica-insensitive protein 2-like [Gastrolobium bilobum]|uniref:piriformospora indica-insensitive protein 2-like n=1 Tax=Gastrolobium bilobum TaxID=150636 RepID=UPI002AB189A9|nr:piriformospora indica-insensitive protein 2-like [Gastrolobium bilobum]
MINSPCDSDDVVFVHENKPELKSKPSTLAVKDDDDDDCEVLEGDPEKCVVSVDEDATGSDKLHVVGEKGQTWMYALFVLFGWVSCDLFNGFWYVTDLNIGPIHENSLSCAKILEFRPQLFELKHLKALSFFKLFESQHRNQVTIPKGNWEKLAGSLESLEFRSNTGLIGLIPSSFGVLMNPQSLVLLENGLTDEIPPDIGNLNKLKKHVLAVNYFTGKIPDVFSALTELLIFDLSRNSCKKY